MIGVISKPSQRTVVEEFFQLFKTPWEFFQEGRSYDVFVATTNDVPNAGAKLLVVYGTDNGAFDAQAGIVGSVRLRSATLNYQGAQLPIYNEVLTFERTGATEVCVTADSMVAGLKIDSGDSTLLRVGYDLFGQIQFLLSVGQPVENAHIPALEIHIAMLREWMINAGVHFIEIPPVPAGHPFVGCLTHDIDFVGIRRHKFDHTMWGFVYRATLGATSDFITGLTSIGRLFRNWRAAASLPFVHLGWVPDFWMQFDWYLRLEKGLRATYFFIPFKNRAGDRVSAGHGRRRASAYDVGDVPELIGRLLREGCEVGVHGIDAWHDVGKAHDELGRVAAITGSSKLGVRIHWLLHDEDTFRVLEEAGYIYDATVGYNETIGYRSGTTQVFRPFSASKLCELPLHIQDGALFFRQRLDLSEAQAWQRCGALIRNAQEFGGVLTLLWHDRSPGPERNWGEFYVRLVDELKSLDVWFGTASEIVNWFQSRRAVTFERVESYDGTEQLKVCANSQAVTPPLSLRFHRLGGVGQERQGQGGQTRDTVDVSWSGETDVVMEELARSTARPSAAPGTTVPHSA
jgi:hypothetical protein